MIEGDRSFLSMIVPRGIGADLFHATELWCVAVLIDAPNIELGTNQLRIVAADPHRERMEAHLDALSEHDPTDAFFLIHLEPSEE